MMANQTETDPGGVVVPFVRRRPQPTRMTMSERIFMLRWADEARSHGVRAVRIHEPEPGDDPEVGEFVLVYRQTDVWAAWGVAVGANRYEVWRPGSGVTVGCFGTLQEALHAIQLVA
jgi:hypothetical protein